LAKKDLRFKIHQKTLKKSKLFTNSKKLKKYLELQQLAN